VYRRKGSTGSLLEILPFDQRKAGQHPDSPVLAQPAAEHIEKHGAQHRSCYRERQQEEDVQPALLRQEARQRQDDFTGNRRKDRFQQRQQANAQFTRRLNYPGGHSGQPGQVTASTGLPQG
jgi:hypothetical protein